MPDDFENELRKQLNKSLGGGVVGDPDELYPGNPEKQVQFGPQAVTRTGRIPIFFGDLQKGMPEGSYKMGEYDPYPERIKIEQTLRDPNLLNTSRLLEDTIGHETTHALSPLGPGFGVTPSEISSAYTSSLPLSQQLFNFHSPKEAIEHQLSKASNKETLPTALFGGYSIQGLGEPTDSYVTSTGQRFNVRSAKDQELTRRGALEYLRSNPTDWSRRIQGLVKSYHINPNTGKVELK